MSAFWDGFEKTAAKDARLGRMLKALGKRKIPARDVHAALRANDLKNQVRGINPYKETSVLTSTANAAKVQANKGFSGISDSVVPPPVGGHT